MTQVSMDERVSSMERLCAMALECCTGDAEKLRSEKLELLRLGLNTPEVPMRAVFARYERLIEQKLQELGA